jgi:alanine or glycine:cation symporter, AGCS family
MGSFIDSLNDWTAAIGNVLWHDSVLYILLGTGVLFTVWSGFSQWRALTHGAQVLRGKYDDPNDPGAINHFQALSAALSATVGLGNIGGVALAITLGGPGAVFWIWVVGLVGMALKMVEVLQSMMYRNTHDRDEPHGGPMWVVSKGIAEMKPELAWLGKTIGVIFCITLLVSAITGGNMFQAWNVGEITESYFGVPSIVTGVVLAVLVGLVIIGGIKRIGAVAGRLVPFMVALYLIASLLIIGANITEIPSILKLIVVSAFVPHQAAGAFMGGAAGYVFLIGMQRALFSNEAGQGSAPIAHSAAKTDEPVREALVSGMEPFIDTIVVCTLTAVVILSTGVWDRGAAAHYDRSVEVIRTDLNVWSLPTERVPDRSDIEWSEGQTVFLYLEGDYNTRSGNNLHRLTGTVRIVETGPAEIEWDEVDSIERPRIVDGGVFMQYSGATLTARAFDSFIPGLGMWLVTLAVWLFAISTMISWSYYGEQGMVYMLGQKSVMPYKFVYCGFVIVATMDFVTTDTELNNLTSIGTGVMLWANIPIMLLFGAKAIRAYKDYIKRLDSGEMEPGHDLPSLYDLMSGRDVERAREARDKD